MPGKGNVDEGGGSPTRSTGGTSPVVERRGPPPPPPIQDAVIPRPIGGGTGGAMPGGGTGQPVGAQGFDWGKLFGNDPYQFIRMLMGGGGGGFGGGGWGGWGGGGGGWGGGWPRGGWEINNNQSDYAQRWIRGNQQGGAPWSPFGGGGGYSGGYPGQDNNVLQSGPHWGPPKPGGYSGSSWYPQRPMPSQFAGGGQGGTNQGPGQTPYPRSTSGAYPGYGQR
jgi:hypothetical protein